MRQIQEQIKEIEKKQKRNMFLYIFIALLVLVIFYFFLNKSQEDELIVKEKTEKLKRHEFEDDSVRRIQAVKIDKVNRDMDLLEKQAQTGGESNSKEILKLVDSVRSTLTSIYLTADITPVRYYVRSADNNKIEDALKSMNSPNFTYFPVEIKDDDSTSNTLYYGKDIREARIDSLMRHLNRNGVELKQSKEFYMGYKWKDAALEIGWERIDSTTKENSNIVVRLCCMNVNSGEKDTKAEKIAHAVANEGYKFLVISNVRKDMTNIPNRSSILYADKRYESKIEELKKNLFKKTKERFEAKLVSKSTLSLAKENTDILVFYKKK